MTQQLMISQLKDMEAFQEVSIIGQKQNLQTEAMDYVLAGHRDDIRGISYSAGDITMTFTLVRRDKRTVRLSMFDGNPADGQLAYVEYRRLKNGSYKMKCWQYGTDEDGEEIDDDLKLKVGGTMMAAIDVISVVVNNEIYTLKNMDTGGMRAN